MQRGTDLEPAALAAYEEQTGLIMQPLVLEAGAYSASLDGTTLEGDLLLEIKCPLRGTRSELWQGVLDGEVPAHYRIKVQHQLMVSGAQTALLWVYDGSKGLLHAIERDEGAMLHIQAAWDEFQRHLDTDYLTAAHGGRYSCQERFGVGTGRTSLPGGQGGLGSRCKASGAGTSGDTGARYPSQGVWGGCDGHAVMAAGQRGLQEDPGATGGGPGSLAGEGEGGGEGSHLMT